MKAFMDQDFMLYNETAKKLFHAYAEKQPILDYHCHLSAKEIYENRPAQTIAELWLGGDHYKWRAMRANGVPEEKITGSADGYEKFAAFAETLTNAIGNPLYHWA
ncbi:MAG: glucuronate isomerase, partial [Ruthenibacterium sp.]